MMMKTTVETGVLALDLEFNGTGRLELDERGLAMGVSEREGRIALLYNADGNVYGRLVDLHGAVDTTWGLLGGIELKFSYEPGHHSQGWSLTELPSGRFLVSGIVLDQGSTYRAFAAYTRAGGEDRTFGNDGRVVINDWPLNATKVLAVDAEGSDSASAEVGGDFILDEGAVIFTVPTGLVKLTPNGALDLSFGSGGGGAQLRSPNPRATFRARSACLRGGSIVVHGSLTFVDRVEQAIVQVTRDGQIDTRFGEQGWFIEAGNGAANVQGIVAMPEDEVVLISGDMSAHSGVLLGVDAQGDYSERFNDAEAVEIVAGGDTTLLAGQLASGTLVVRGYVTQGSMTSVLLVGCDPYGAPDARFGPQGWAKGFAGLVVMSMAVQVDGRILLACRDLGQSPAQPLFLRVMGLAGR